MTNLPRVQAAFDRLDTWVVDRDYAGWDPHDALNSPGLAALAGGHRLAGQLIVQAVKRSPLNVRPLFGVRAGRNPKGIGLFLASYCRQYERQRTPLLRSRIHALAGWLDAHRSARHPGAGWGYNFAWPNRSFQAPAGTPTIVNTAFNGLAFVAMADAFAMEDATASAKALSIAGDACHFVRTGLNRIHDTPDELCLSYTPLDRRAVHNASLLGGWLLAEVGKRTADQALLRDAGRIARFTARRQSADGSWPYGEAANDRFVDNFHTAYVLVALGRIGRANGTDEFESAVNRGFALWRQEFFDREGRPRYFRHQTFPIDSHCAAQAILTLLEFREVGGAAAAAERLTDWMLDHMQDPSGYFYYQRTRLLTNRIPYMRWVQAWMHRSLSEYLHVGSKVAA